jgi:hypothetical protein
MASRDLEKEFDPTQWSSRFSDPKKLLESHVEFGNRGDCARNETIFSLLMLLTKLFW